MAVAELKLGNGETIVARSVVVPAPSGKTSTATTKRGFYNQLKRRSSASTKGA